MMRKLQHDAIEHICYEIGRLCESYERWLVGSNQARSKCEVNDLIELILLHARTLIDFFEGSRTGASAQKKVVKADDIFSEDYSFPAAPIAIVASEKRRINKEIAHLTYARCGLSGQGKQWTFSNFIPEVLRQSYRFCDHMKLSYWTAIDERNRRLVAGALRKTLPYK